MIPNDFEEEDFLDPIYESIYVRKGSPRPIRIGNEDQNGIDYLGIIRSPEFSRLAFLRQAGTAWLRFPSATHTRFAHSIGAYWLGYLALTSVRVNIEREHTNFQFGDWLKTNELKDEFLLSLLLHDIGHLPLSHVLEKNDDLLESFKLLSEDSGDKVDVSTHEKRAVTILKGIGPIYNEFMKGSSYRDSNLTGSNTIKSILDRHKNLCIDAIAYAITGDQSYLDKCNHGHKVAVKVMKEFVSGILDLDRTDHIARDAYFSTLKSTPAHPIAILRGLKIFLDGDIEGGNLEWRLTRDAVSHALSLLFDRKMLYSLIFHNEQVIALETMISFALSYHLRSFTSVKKRSKEALKISVMGDDEFIHYMYTSKDVTARSLTSLYSNRVYYRHIKNVDGTDIPNNIRPKINEILMNIDREYRDKYSDSHNLPFIIWKIDDVARMKFGQNYSSDWLSFAKFVVEEKNGKSHYLINDPEFGQDFQVLKEDQKRGYVHVFINPAYPADNDKVIIKRILDDLEAR
jgi:HD superfamily phosphohydrolase